MKPAMNLLLPSLLVSAILVACDATDSDKSSVDVDSGHEDTNEDDNTTDSCFEISFVGGFNGRVEGSAEQCVAGDESSTPVEALPRSGFTFTGWSDGNTENPRTITNPDQDQVISAQFDTEGLKTVWLGHSFIRWNVELLYDVAKNDAGYDQHEDWMTFSGGAGGAPGSLWDAPGKRASGQAMIREIKPDNVVMTYHPVPGTSDYEDYTNWIDYTLEHSPNARFYISLPWRNVPFGNNVTDPILSEDGAEDLEAFYNNEQFPLFNEEILSPLREDYPDNEFILIPQALAADRIFKAHFANTLTFGEDEESLFLRNPDNGAIDEHEQSIFDDNTGHPGGPLRLLTMMLYMNYIYGVETSSFTFWEEKQFFSNLGLEGIGPKETFDVPYTTYNGFDFPAAADEIFKSYGRGE